MQKIRCLILLLFFMAGLVQADAQKQLVVLKNEKVLLRLYPGDELVFTLKGSKKVRKSYVNNLFDTAVVVHQDVIPYHKIGRIYFKRGNLLNVVGGLLVTGGVGYFLIDQVNVVLVHGEEANINSGVATSSAIMAGVGLPMMLVQKKYVRLGGKYRVLMVDKGSGFYVPDLRRNADEAMTD
jgi:hypothetical protein